MPNLNFEQQSKYARLFIASEVNQIEALKWRIALIKKHKLLPIPELLNLITRLNKNSTNPPTINERTAFTKLALAEEFDIDELDLAAMFIANLLLQKNEISDDHAIIFDKMARVIMETRDLSKDEFLESHRSHIELAKSNLKMYANNLLEFEISNIRARLAMKEIAAFIDPDKMIPHLVSISPKYLASHLTQKWIRKFQYLRRFGKKTEKESAQKNLKLLTKAISGDGRKAKARKRPYWKLAFFYENVSSHILGFRKGHKEKNFDDEYFDLFCEHFEIAPAYRDIILFGKVTPKELTLEIMCDLGHIESPKTFREIQPHLAKIQEKHYDGKIISIASELDPYLFRFIDLPTQHPELIERMDVFSVLEKVRI